MLRIIDPPLYRALFWKMRMGDSPPQFGNSPASPLVPELAPRGVPHTFRALRHRNFRLFIGGQIVSLVGTWMQNVAQAWLVYRLTHSELLLGTVWFCSQIAVFALGPLGGIAADRFSRRKVVIVTQTLSMVQAFALAALTLSGRVQVWQVLVLAGLLGAINAFDMPGRQALVIQMTSKEDLINAISLNSAVLDRKSTRLNSSHLGISYAVFCLKKKNTTT